MVSLIPIPGLLKECLVASVVCPFLSATTKIMNLASNSILFRYFFISVLCVPTVDEGAPSRIMVGDEVAHLLTLRLQDIYESFVPAVTQRYKKYLQSKHNWLSRPLSLEYTGVTDSMGTVFIDLIDPENYSFHSEFGHFLPLHDFLFFKLSPLPLGC